MPWWEIFVGLIGFTSGFVACAFMAAGANADTYNPYDPEARP